MTTDYFISWTILSWLQLTHCESFYDYDYNNGVEVK